VWGRQGAGALLLVRSGAHAAAEGIGREAYAFHQQTAEQAGEDHRRERVLQRLGLPLLRFTGTEIVRNKSEVAWEIAAFVHQKLSEKQARLAEIAEREAEYAELVWLRWETL